MSDKLRNRRTRNTRADGPVRRKNPETESGAVRHDRQPPASDPGVTVGLHAAASVHQRSFTRVWVSSWSAVAQKTVSILPERQTGRTVTEDRSVRPAVGNSLPALVSLLFRRSDGVDVRGGGNSELIKVVRGYYKHY